MPYFYFDPTYIVIIPALIFALWAQANVSSTYNKFSKIPTRSGMTGYEAARQILDSNGLMEVKIEQIAGNLTDHYDPKKNVIRLSDGVYSSKSVAAVGVAAHEAGHAVQYAQNYGPIKLRAAVIPATRIGSVLALPIFLIGLLFSIYELALTGIVLFSLTAIFQAITLPVEFNASRRALAALGSSAKLGSDEIDASRKVLRAAALTYVAALASSLAQIFRLLLIVNSGRRNR